MSFFKALIPGLILTLIVTTILGTNGSSGGFLSIHLTQVAGHHFYWSWQLFCAATALAWGIFWMME